MRCPKCGRELGENDAFCPSCGTRPTEGTSGKNDLPDPEQSGRAGKEAPFPPDNKKEEVEPGASLNGYAVPPGKRSPGDDPLTDRARADRGPNDGGRGRGGSRFVRCLKALVAVILFILLLSGIQSCVAVNFAVSNLSLTSLEDAMLSDDEALMEAAREELQRGTEALLEKQVQVLLLANALAILSVCILFRLRSRSPSREFALHGVNPGRLIQMALFGIALNVTISVLFSFIPFPASWTDMQENQYSSFGGAGLALELLSVAVIAPIAEEIFFRGLSLTRLEPAFGGAGAVLIASLFFGLAHGTPIAIIYSFLVGLILSVICLRYGSILPGIVVHCFFNMTALWLDRLPDLALYVLLALSVGVIVWVFCSAVLFYPRFIDVLWDQAGRIRVKNPEKQAVLLEIRRLRETNGGDPAELDALARRWEEAEEAEKKAGRPDNK